MRWVRAPRRNISLFSSLEIRGLTFLTHVESIGGSKICEMSGQGLRMYIFFSSANIGVVNSPHILRSPLLPRKTEPNWKSMYIRKGSRFWKSLTDLNMPVAQSGKKTVEKSLRHPTCPFAILEPQNQGIDEFYEVQKCHADCREALKLRKEQWGKRF